MSDSPSLSRLNRAIAARGVCGRRKADELIFAGKVKVNGEIETNPGRRVAPTDSLEIYGRKFESEPEKVYLMLNKPVHCVSTVSDPQGRATVLDFVPAEFRSARVYPVGRLDYFSEGLLLLTNDGDLAYRLTHPSFEKEKIYEVAIRGDVPASAVAAMENGITLSDGTRLLPARVKSLAARGGDSVLTLALRQGINRQIRRMCDELNLTILSLKRVAEGSLVLGDLKSGQCRELTAAELKKLKD